MRCDENIQYNVNKRRISHFSIKDMLLSRDRMVTVSLNDTERCVLFFFIGSMTDELFEFIKVFFSSTLGRWVVSPNQF